MHVMMQCLVEVTADMNHHQRDKGHGLAWREIRAVMRWLLGIVHAGSRDSYNLRNFAGSELFILLGSIKLGESQGRMEPWPMDHLEVLSVRKHEGNCVTILTLISNAPNSQRLTVFRFPAS